MPITKRPGGTYLPWYYDIQAKGRARKRAKGNPKRDILMVKSALNKLSLRYCQEVSFWNDLHNPETKFGKLDGGLQWVDFVASKKGRRAFAIILDDPRKRYHAHERVALESKQKGLIAQGTPVLKLPAGRTSQEYWATIHIFMLRNKTKGV
jgi:hypothetical protein